MDLIFLGTSAGSPTKTRNVTALALCEDRGSGWYLVDCGEGTQQQLLRTNLSVNSLRAIFIPHVHGDHCYGLPGLLASAGMNGRTTPLKIIAPKGIKEWFESTQVHTHLGLPFDLEYICSDTLPTVAFDFLSVSTTALSHRVPSYAYSFGENQVEASLDTEKLNSEGIPQGPMWGDIQKGIDVLHQGKIIDGAEFLRFDNVPRKIVIGGDNDNPSLLRDACNNSNVLVHEATFTKDVAAKVGQVIAQNLGHSYAELVSVFAESVAIPNLVLTHFSPRYQSNSDASPSIRDIYNEAASVYHGALFMAEDFARYRLSKNGSFRQVEQGSGLNLQSLASREKAW